MVSLHLPVLLLHLGLFAAQGSAHNDDDFDVLGSFNRAAYWEATTIGDYIYIDGGQISIEDDDGPFQLNQTLSIDGSIPWRPEDVDIRVLNRSSQIPTLSNPCIFPTADSFYIWGGIFPGEESDEAPPRRLWQFTADGHGSGDWDFQSVSNTDVFESIPYRESSACASTEGRAFVFGGTNVTTINGQSRLGDQSTGLVTFDFETRTFDEQDENENDDDDDGYRGNYSGDGSVWGGTATFVPNFGDEGVIVLIGGEVGRDRYGGSGTFRDMMSVSVYDVAAKKWHAQQARLGDATDPPPRVSHHCAVGVADTADGTSFEIFVYGGTTHTQSYDNYGGIYVLSLPSFTWTEATDRTNDDFARSHHACVNLPNNSGLFVSLGGIQTSGGKDTWEDKDPFPQSIGIYDMNNLTWVDSYNPSAGGYVTNNRIRSWSHDTPRWSSNELRELFSTMNDDDDADNEDSVADAEKEGMIIAGSVVGGVAGLGVVAALVALILHLRRRHQQKGSVKCKCKSKDSDLPSIEERQIVTPPKLTISPPPPPTRKH